MNREAIHRHIDEHLEQHIGHIQEWVRQPSVSWDNLGTREAAELVGVMHTLYCGDDTVWEVEE